LLRARVSRRVVDLRALPAGSRRRTPRGVIRLLEPADGADLAALYTANWDFLAPFEPERDESFFTARTQRRRIERMSGDEYWLWGICDDADGPLIGMIALSDVSRGPLQMANVGYWVAREHNGRGLASSAVADVAAFALTTAGLHRLEAATLPDNLASQRVLEK